VKVAVTGSSGLIGIALVASLRADGHEVIRLVRRTPRAADEVRWDPRTADAGLFASGAPGSSALAGLGGCVHLAGAGVADRRWTARYKAEIRTSRAPAPALRLAVGQASVELLTSARVLPRRLQQAGYEFRSPALPDALAAELGS